jgi:hypothetical protein
MHFDRAPWFRSPRPRRHRPPEDDLGFGGNPAFWLDESLKKSWDFLPSGKWWFNGGKRST